MFLTLASTSTHTLAFNFHFSFSCVKRCVVVLNRTCLAADVHACSMFWQSWKLGFDFPLEISVLLWCFYSNVYLATVV